MMTNAEIDNILSEIVHPDALGFYQSNAVYNTFRKFADVVVSLRQKETKQMTDRELMQMALEELEELADVGYGSKTVIQAMRDRLAQWKALDRMVAENERLGLYDDLDEAIKKGTKAWDGVDPTKFVEDLRGIDTATVGEVGIWGELTPCKDHPDAPHGFDRNASLSLDRYVCECESWEPPPEPKPVAWADKHDIERDGHDFYVSRQQPAKDGVPLYNAPPHCDNNVKKREWIGLTEEEVDQCYADTADEFQFYQAIEAKLKEKNT